MSTLLIVVIIAAIILFILGFLGTTLHFLFWLAGVLIVIAIILFIVRAVTGRRV